MLRETRCPEMRLTMLLDLAYVAVGIGSLTVFWLFVKACDRL